MSRLGLWIGVSLISFVEIAELLVLLLTHGLCGSYNRWKTHNQPNIKVALETEP